MLEMYILIMNIEDIEKKIEDFENTLHKVKELIADFKVCTSDITKTLVSSAVKKYLSTLPDLKQES